MNFEPVTVQAYAGYKANERPVSFISRGRNYRGIEIIDRWYEGSGGAVPLDYFKVAADDGRDYLLRYNGLFDAWALVAGERDVP
jgi:hypothetical protein